MTFDYGRTLPDGQYENYPTNKDGEFVAPIRNTYYHIPCSGTTTCGDGIAETYAKNPTYYTRTYCATCQGHFPISEFRWTIDGTKLGEIGNPEHAGADWKNMTGYITKPGKSGTGLTR